ITLLDDLYTTGRTLYHARDALVAAGFKGTIQAFTLIR
ncbi:ComF operon protein 3, partial [Lacticaseibacillus rhamnosus MTCC 5462]